MFTRLLDGAVCGRQKQEKEHEQSGPSSPSPLTQSLQGPTGAKILGGVGVGWGERDEMFAPPGT